MSKTINQMEPWYGKEEKKAILEYLNSGGWLMEFKKKALGIKDGDEVIVPDYTMIATPNTVVMAGARPVFVDVDETFCLNPDLVSKAITSKTKAIIHVSINGRAGGFDKLRSVCKKKKIYLMVILRKPTLPTAWPN